MFALGGHWPAGLGSFLLWERQAAPGGWRDHGSAVRTERTCCFKAPRISRHPELAIDWPCTGPLGGLDRPQGSQ